MQKLINNVDVVVDDSIRGLLSVNSNIRLIQGTRVVIRSDIDDKENANKVAVICGGGSGHEPAFAGYVGKGFLSAGVCGDVFTSPNPNQIIAALNACRRPAGILVVVFNYTGDRLNFAIAVERFKSQKNACPVETVYVADDCALTDLRDRSAGRRGLAGGIMVLKMACGAAERGLSLEAVTRCSQEFISSLRTIGISLSSCSLPGRGPLFELPADEMELGLGVHGEPGVARMKTATAVEVIGRMMNHMTDPSSATSFSLSESDEVVVLVNNLGGMSQIEMNIAANEVLEWLNVRNVKVKRYITGPLMTSLEMRGVSISVLKVMGRQWLEFLDLPVMCPAWPTVISSPAAQSIAFSPDSIVPAKKETETTDTLGGDITSISEESAAVLISSVQAACNALIKSHSELDDLDAKCGDGDCGATMKRGAEALLKALPSMNANQPHIFLQQIASTWQQNTGGTSGAIYSLFFMASANALASSTDAKAWLKGLVAGTEAVMKHGGAKPGDRTLVDVLYAAQQVAQKMMEKGKVGKEDLKELKQVVKTAAESTSNLKAKAGRASYVSSEHWKFPDPGAMGCYLWIDAVISVIEPQV